MPVSRSGSSKPQKSKKPTKSKSSQPKPKPRPSKYDRNRPSVSSSVSTSSVSAELGEEFQEIGETINDLATQVTLNTHRDAASDLDTGIADLFEQVEIARSRGYVYKSYMERKLETLQGKWEDAEPELERELERHSEELLHQYDRLTEQYNRIAGMGVKGKNQISGLEARVNDLKSRISAAGAALNDIYENIRSTYYQTRAQILEVTWLIDEMDVASFELLANENPVQAVKAKWWRDGKDDGPEGTLYLTDQRLLFEQKEKVATKKVLFVTTESELVQELVFQVPLSGVDAVKPSHKGIGGHQDHLDFDFSDGDFVNAHFHIDGQDCEQWAALVKRVQNGDIQKERWYPEGVDAEQQQKELEQAIGDAPSECNACGAPLPSEVLRGQQSIECEYCGNVMRW